MDTQLRNRSQSNEAWAQTVRRLGQIPVEYEFPHIPGDRVKFCASGKIGTIIYAITQLYVPPPHIWPRQWLPRRTMFYVLIDDHPKPKEFWGAQYFELEAI